MIMEEHFNNILINFAEQLQEEQKRHLENESQRLKEKVIRLNVINDACEWLEENLPRYWGQINANDTKGFIEDFKKAMEE